MSSFETLAKEYDSKDPLKEFRKRFSLPHNKIYLCSHSLGMPASDAFSHMQEELKNWKEYGASGWFSKEWISASDLLKKPLSQILGAHPDEVVVMNSLTVNLHLLWCSFFQPTRERNKVLIEAPTFSSDLYALKSHLEGLPSDTLIILKPREGEWFLEMEAIEEILEKEGEKIACLFLNGVNFLTGQALEIPKIIKIAKKKGCLVGLDLAHAAGNIFLKLHEWKVDFAVGCSYKYLSSGPGGPGFAFIHRDHHGKKLPYFRGWWGNDPKTRFEMQPDFAPSEGASSWQLSTPSILASLPFAHSLKIFEEAKMEKIRAKSVLQTSFLIELLERQGSAFKIVTPKNPDLRGSQISLYFPKSARKILSELDAKNIIVDFRSPDVIRVAPHPLYNTFNELYDFSLRLFDI